MAVCVENNIIDNDGGQWAAALAQGGIQVQNEPPEVHRKETEVHKGSTQ